MHRRSRHLVHRSSLDGQQDVIWAAHSPRPTREVHLATRRRAIERRSPAGSKAPRSTCRPRGRRRARHPAPSPPPRAPRRRLRQTQRSLPDRGYIGEIAAVLLPLARRHPASIATLVAASRPKTVLAPRNGRGRSAADAMVLLKSGRGLDSRRLRPRRRGFESCLHPALGANAVSRTPG